MRGPLAARIRRLLLRSESSRDTIHAHASERNRRAALTGGAATLARLVQIGTSLVTIPLTLKYLGNERFGLWMTISSVLAMAAFADFGVGNGVLNTVAHAYGEDDAQGIREAVSSGFALLSGIAAVLLLAFVGIYRFVDWANFFRVASPQARAEAGPALAVFALCFALNIAMDVVQRVQLGLQQGYRFGLWQMCGSSAALIGVLCGIALHVSLPLLVMAIAGAPLLATALNALHFFGFLRPDLRPRTAFVSRAVMSRIAKLGGMFFVLQVVVAVASSADNFIIARNLGAASVPEYSIPQRMFALVSMMSAMLLSGLWPAYGEAVSRGHIAWIRQALRRSLLTVFGVSFTIAGALLLLSPKLIFWWVGARIHPPFVLLAGLALLCVIECSANAISVFLNGAGLMRLQVIVATVFGVTCLAAKVYFIRRFGITAVPWSTIGAWWLVALVPFLVYIPRSLARIEAGVAARRESIQSLQ